MTALELAHVIYAELSNQEIRIGKWSNEAGIVFFEPCVVNLVSIAAAILKAQSAEASQ